MKLRSWISVHCIWFLACIASAHGESQRPLIGGWKNEQINESVTEEYGSEFDFAPLDAFVEEVIRRWHLPGISIAVVKGNETTSKGYGYAQFPDAVMTPETLFYCGSTTKSFTAAAMSLLVDDNEAFPHVQWTTPVSQLLRDDFVLSDEWATNHITIEDALSHRTGYPGHTLGINNTTPREAVRRLRHLPMSAEPRTEFQYSNYMFTAVGHLIEVLTGQWLGDFFRSRLWDPMEMQHTYLTREDAETSGHPLAAEYRWQNDTDSFDRVPHLPNGRGREAAGMVISNVLDYARYLRIMMAEASPLSLEGHKAVRRPRTIIGDMGSPFTGPLYYSLGWSGGVIEGQRFWFHNGQIREHVSQMWMFPDKGFALVSLANADSPAPEIILWRIIYELLGIRKDARWDAEEAMRQREHRRTQALDTCKSRLYPHIRDEPIPRQLPLRALTGVFQDAGYGNLTIGLECPTHNPFPEGTTPVHLTRDGSCYLQSAPMMGLEGRSFHLAFEHVTGQFWIGWVILDEKALGEPVQQQQRPTLCVRAEIRLDERGIVRRIGLDLRQESELGPLVWFERIV